VVQDLGVATLQLPRGEEERPVDVGAELDQVRFDHARARERRLGQVPLAPDDRRSALGRDPVRQQRLGLALPGELAEGFLVPAGVRGGRGARSSEPRPPTRDASTTWTTGWPYSGAIRTAVCCREVVAPPISSGRSRPRRSISLATPSLSPSDGGLSPEQRHTAH